jgi:hypothetical protein
MRHNSNAEAVSAVQLPGLAEQAEIRAKAQLRKTPDGYAQSKMGMKLHPKQAAVLRDLFPGAGRKSRVSLRKANEVGGTRRIVAVAVLFALDILNAVVISTAGKWLQVSTQLIPALKAFQHLYPSWEFQDTCIKIKGIERYIGFSTISGFAQGFHRTEGRPLVAIIDEAGLVDKGIFDDMEDRCNPDYFLCAGAPMDPVGQFYDNETRLARLYKHHHISQLDCLTTAGWWIDPADIERKIAKYGSKDHPFIQSNVFGEFAAKVEGGLLSLAEFNACLANPPPHHPGVDNRHLFIDVGLNNCAAMRHGNKVWIEKRWVDGSIAGICGEVIRIATCLNNSVGLQPWEISVDAQGDYGKQVCDGLARMGWHINRFAGQSHEVRDPDYYNAISEAWLGGCALIKRGEIIIPDDDNVRAQCLSRKQRAGPGGKLQVEPKDEYMKRGFDSPHEGDAVFGAIMPVVWAKSVNLSGYSNDEPDQRGWVERARDEEGSWTVTPAEGCL